jgi:excisionase family DNA binding protein
MDAQIRRVMEKICIVKRRKKYLPEVGVGNSYSFADNHAIQKKEGYFLGELPEENKHVLSFGLTPEQNEKIQSNDHIKSLLSGMTRSVSLNVQQCEQGQIVFKFHFDNTETVKMLKPEHVCQMLQISKSFLSKLVTANKIRSYKLGRLRRFSMSDILEYLTGNQEFDIMKYTSVFSEGD